MATEPEPATAAAAPTVEMTDASVDLETQENQGDQEDQEAKPASNKSWKYVLVFLSLSLSLSISTSIQSASLAVTVAVTDLDIANTRPPHLHRRKYRKLRVKFEHEMRKSEALFRAEQKGMETLRRLQEECECVFDHLFILISTCLRTPSTFTLTYDGYYRGLRELLLDINEDEDTPAHLRIELPPADQLALPAEDFPEFVDEVSDKKKGKEKASAGGSEQDKQKQKEKEQADRSARRAYHVAKVIDNLPKDKPIPLSMLLHMPHARSVDIAEKYMPEELSFGPNGDEPPLTYFTPAQESAWLDELDKTLSEEGPKQRSKASQHQSASVIEREEDKEIALKNPVSVYNWLRRNHPQVFLQDKEAIAAAEKNGHGHGGASTAAGGGGGGSKGGARAGGKRASTSAKSHLADIGIDDDFETPAPAKSSRSRRKRAPDDETAPKRRSKSGNTGKKATKSRIEREPSWTEIELDDILTAPEEEGDEEDEEEDDLEMEFGPGEYHIPTSFSKSALSGGAAAAGGDGGKGVEKGSKRKREEDKGYRPKDGANGRASGSRRNRNRKGKEEKRSSSGAGAGRGEDGGDNEDAEAMNLDGM